MVASDKLMKYYDRYLFVFVDTGPYITELLSRIPDESMKQKISTFLIARSQMDIGEVLAKGLCHVTVLIIKYMRRFRKYLLLCDSDYIAYLGSGLVIIYYKT